jgi:hypothetical protein
MFLFFRWLSIRHADGDVGIPQDADETSAFPGRGPTGTSAFPRMPTRRRRSRGIGGFVSDLAGFVKHGLAGSGLCALGAGEFAIL